MKARTFALVLSCSASALSAGAQDFEMLIRGGHVLDARNDVDDVMDVAIDDGVIAEVAASIDPSRADAHGSET